MRYIGRATIQRIPCALEGHIDPFRVSETKKRDVVTEAITTNEKEEVAVGTGGTSTVAIGLVNDIGIETENGTENDGAKEMVTSLTAAVDRMSGEKAVTVIGTETTKKETADARGVMIPRNSNMKNVLRGKDKMLATATLHRHHHLQQACHRRRHHLLIVPAGIAPKTADLFSTLATSSTTFLGINEIIGVTVVDPKRMSMTTISLLQ